MPSPEEERLAPLAMQFLADNFDAMIEEMHTNYQKGEAFAVLDAISWSLDWLIGRLRHGWVWNFCDASTLAAN